MINVYAVNINQKFDKSIIDHLISFLTEDKQERIKNFQRLEDVKRVLIADILLRTVICSDLGIKNKDIVFEKNEYGKPFLKHNHSYYFNVSHSGEWVVCATHNFPVGIDIEHVKPINLDIAKRFFSKEEYNDLTNIDNLQKLSYFYELWTLKESYIKAVGKGLSIPLNSFTLKINNNDIIIKTMNEFCDCFFKQYYIDSNYKMAVCGFLNDFSKDVIIEELDQICKKFLINC